MKTFMRLIQRAFELRMHAVIPEREIGTDTFGALKKVGVIEPDDPAPLGAMETL